MRNLFQIGDNINDKLATDALQTKKFCFVSWRVNWRGMKQTKYEQRKIAFLTGTTNAVDKQTKNDTGFLSHLRARKKSELLSAILIVKRIF